MKLYDKKEILPILLILAIGVLGFYFYPQLPDRVPTHWGVNGEINGWSSKNFAVYFFPALTLLLYALLSVFPIIDPLRKNIETFANLYYWFKVVFVAFMGGMYFMTLWAGVGHAVNVQMLVMLGIAVLFLFIGLILPKIKRNYTIGIRLPWTLHSEKTWEKTHAFGGKLFIVMAALMAVLAFIKGAYAFWILIGGMILLLATLMVYSYWQYRKLEKA